MGDKLLHIYFLVEVGNFNISTPIILFSLLIAVGLVFYLAVWRKKKKPSFSFTPPEQTNFLKSILDHSESGNAVVNAEGKIIYTNFGFSALFDEKDKPLEGKNIEDLPVLNELVNLMNKKLTDELNISSADGENHVLRYYQVKDDSHYLQGTILKVDPEVEKGDDKGGVDLSHELKTPLHAVIGFSELLEKNEDLTNSQQELLEKVIYHSKQLDGKIKSYIDTETGFTDNGTTELVDRPAKKILVVDDVSINRTLLKLMLKRYGINVEEASNGEAALNILDNWHADLVLMDLSMPVMDGIETVRAIRSKPNEISAIKIIAVTATQRYSREELISAGFDDLMQKPFKEKDLLSRIGINAPESP